MPRSLPLSSKQLLVDQIAQNVFLFLGEILVRCVRFLLLHFVFNLRLAAIKVRAGND